MASGPIALSLAISSWPTAPSGVITARTSASAMTAMIAARRLSIWEGYPTPSAASRHLLPTSGEKGIRHVHRERDTRHAHREGDTRHAHREKGTRMLTARGALAMLTARAPRPA